MANIFRVVKDKNYTIVNNEYLKNKNLRVDSIGLLTVILSLPSDFNITMKGLISLTHQKANYRAIKVMLDNLKENGYLEINSMKSVYFLLTNISRSFLVLLLFEFFLFLYLTILGKSKGPNSKIPSLI